MADARALLKARRQEVRISHPFASYSSSGQLRCSTCSIAVKHATAWEGHLGSKGHRTSVARLREQERMTEEASQRKNKEAEIQSAALLGKRKSPADQDMDEDADMEAPEHKKSRQDVAPQHPSNFFSDPSRTLPEIEMPGEEGNRGEAPDSQPVYEGDAEWARFQREVVYAPDYMETYQNATVAAGPVIAPEVPEGFPSQPDESAPNPDELLDKGQTRQQKEREERELIMDRLLEEERAQEEADMKVTVMRNKLDALKRKREAAKAARPQGNS